MGVVPFRMSKLDGEPPKMIGAPRPASWPMTRPDRFSATCWTRVPAIVVGEVAPVMPIEMSSDGMPARAASIRLWVVRLLHLRGGEGQASKMASGLAAERRLSAADRGQEVLHRPEALDPEGPGDERLLGQDQAEVEAERVGDGAGHVGGDEGRALEVDVLEGLDELVDVDDVGRRGLALGLGDVVEKGHGGRARVEMDLVPADGEGPASPAVVERDGGRGRGQAVLDELPADPDPLRAGIDVGPGAREKAQGLGVLDHDAVLFEDGQPFVDDLLDEGRGEELQLRPLCLDHLRTSLFVIDVVPAGRSQERPARDLASLTAATAFSA